MESGETRLNREELYKLVWAEPMRDVAKRFGISDVALAKKCRKMKIPVPGRGNLFLGFGMHGCYNEKNYGIPRR